MICNRQHVCRWWSTAVVAAGVLATPAAAGVRFGGDTGALYTYGLEEFTAYGTRPGTAFSTLGTPELGFTLGEKLVGQVNTPVGMFDAISGTPTVPLTIDASVASTFGVNVISMFSSIVVSGVGPLGFPDRDAIGEGALTVLFGRDQQVFAFDVVGASSGTIRMQFFSRQGEVLDDFDLVGVRDGTFVFTSDARDIAAFTLTNDDFGGLVFDRFVFNPGYDDSPPGCTILAPDSVTPQGDVTEVQLEADSMSDPTGQYADYVWVTDCPGGEFDDITALAPTLWVETVNDCALSCTVSLVVDDVVWFEVCTRTLVFEGAGSSGLICPPDLMVESDGTGNVADLDAWLLSVVADDPGLTSDFEGLGEGCGQTGSATVTWTATSGVGDCAAASECSSTFSLVDTTPPVLDVDTSGLVVEDADCLGSVAVDLPEATATDAGDTPVVVDVEAPDEFPTGETTDVTYTATDACGNTTTAVVEVTVDFGTGIEVQVDQRIVGGRRHNDNQSEPLAGVTVRVCTMAPGRPGHGVKPDKDGGRHKSRHRDDDDDDDDDDHDGDGGRDDEHARGRHSRPVPQCDEVNRATTDATGLALLGVPPGRYFVVADIDVDGDGEADEHVLKNVGKLRCGKWKTRRVVLLVDDDGEPIRHRGSRDD